MPNWCSNRVEIYGEPHEVDAFKELVTSDKSDFDFNKILPMPEALEDTTKGSNHVPSEELKEKYGADNIAYLKNCDKIMIVDTKKKERHYKFIEHSIIGLTKKNLNDMAKFKFYL